MEKHVGGFDNLIFIYYYFISDIYHDIICFSLVFLFLSA